jgi:hypothetical protein
VGGRQDICFNFFLEVADQQIDEMAAKDARRVSPLGDASPPTICVSSPSIETGQNYDTLVFGDVAFHFAE